MEGGVSHEASVECGVTLVQGLGYQSILGMRL